jgi:hypothetical protein
MAKEATLNIGDVSGLLKDELSSLVLMELLDKVCIPRRVFF